jgi:tetratricopeptide (TPR) repeat protein
VSRGAVAAEAPRRLARPEAAQRARRVSRNESPSTIARDAAHDETGGAAWPPRNAPAPLQGMLANIDRAIKAGNVKSALAQAHAWHAQEPGNVLALIGLGEALEASRDPAAAARIYGSIIDLFPGRADLRRFAGERLERIGAAARPLAVDTYQRAVEERPDHMTGHRLLAYALLRTGRHAEAFAAILAGVDQRYPGGRFAGGERVLADDAGLIGAAYAAAMPGKRAEITAALTQRGLALPTRASTRFIMYWETDANDVDFHIQDARGGHAFYSNKQLPSGGELYADITTGYGPECFAIEGTPKAGPYKLSIDYYSQGPMGYGMGLLQIVRHDGKGTLSFDDRPYVIMADHAYVDLGTFR